MPSHVIDRIKILNIGGGHTHAAIELEVWHHLKNTIVYPWLYIPSQKSGD